MKTDEINKGTCEFNLTCKDAKDSFTAQTFCESYSDICPFNQGKLFLQEVERHNGYVESKMSRARMGFVR